MKNATKYIFSALLACAAAFSGAASLSAQTKTNGGATTVDGIVEFDKTVHDFGDILESDGPQSCSFTLKNISSKPIAILTVTSSCGCTDVTWTKEPLQPGKSGKIEAVFSNDQGPYPFDKNLTVYVSDLKKPVVLRLRGVTHAKKQSLAELYPVHLGNLGLKDTEIKLGNMNQGSQRSDEIYVANLGGSPMTLSFKDVTSGMKIESIPATIPAGQTGKIRFTITASRDKWGKNYYYATPVAGGRALGKTPLAIWTFTKEDFTGLSTEEINKGAQPVFDSSTFNFNVVKPGSKIEAKFTFKNQGKSDFKVYKIDSDTPGVTTVPMSTVKPGAKGELNLTFDTTGLPKGEVLAIITLTTNSPLRPIVNLFLSGAIQ